MHYAKADPDDLLMAISVTNAGPDADTLHVLPTAWFRNTWSWDDRRAQAGRMAADRRHVRPAIEHPFLGTARAARRPPAPDGDGTGPALFCENETNTKRLFGAEPITPYPKDGINDHVIRGAPTVNPRAHRHQVRLLVQGHRAARPDGRAAAAAAAGRRRASAEAAAAFGAGFDQVMAQRRAEADEFYAELTPADGDRRRGDGHAAGVRRDAVEQAAVLLRRGPLAGRRPDPADAAAPSG